MAALSFPKALYNRGTYLFEYTSSLTLLLKEKGTVDKKLLNDE